MYSRYKKFGYKLLVLTIMLLMVSGCGARGTDLDDQNVPREDEGNGVSAAADSDSVQTAEPDESRKVKYQMDAEAMAELEDSMFDGIGLASKLEESFSYDRQKWFEAYNGEKIQRILGTGEVDENSGPAEREDIIFYRAEKEEGSENAVVTMIDAMMSPLMEPSDRRGYTILEYEIAEEQPMIKIGEGIWILYYIDGYYRYEGTDLVTMEQYMESEPGLELENGMMPFQRQGSDSVFLYLLLQEGDVYRLQRYESMMSSGK